MKKLFVLAVALLATFGLTACGETTETTTATPTTTVFTGVLEDADKSFWATGNFAGWGDAAGNTMYQMEAISQFDERVAGLELDGVELLYLLEVTLPAEAAGWDVTYTIDGTETVLDGNLTVKVIRTASADVDNIPEWWAQSPESGELGNLTPATLYMPEFVETSETGAGTWNDNPVALAAGTYYMVFAEFTDGARALGLVEVPAA